MKLLIKNNNNIKFTLPQEYSLEELKRIQTELLHMIEIIANLFENNNINYFIAYGTLMGAVKFKGFLPWDDDIDLFLFDDEYERAISVLEKNLPTHLIIHGEKNDKNYFLSWNKVKNLKVEVEINDIYNPDNQNLGFKNLGIDLYRLKRLKSTDVNDYLKKEAINFFERKLRARMVSKEEFLKQVNRINSHNFTFPLAENSINIDEEVYVFVVKMNKPILTSQIFPLKKYEFENLTLFGPNKPEEVLLTYFSNIDKLPPVEERKPHLKKVRFL